MDTRRNARNVGLGAIAALALAVAFDDQTPAVHGQTSNNVGHENLRVVEMSDISTKPGGSPLHNSSSATNLVAGYT